MTIYVGQSIVKKHGGMGLGAQRPAPEVEASFTQEPIDVAESTPERKVLTHRHFGHPEEHPVTLRHRKASADPSHGEEDKIIDEYKDLYDKARKGECNPLEMKRVHELRGRLQEIQATREGDARRILGRDMVEAADAQGGTFSLKPRTAPAKPAAPKPSGGNLLTQTASGRSGKTFKGEYPEDYYGDDVEEEGGLESTISWSVEKAVDAVLMASSTIMKAHNGEPHYPADEEEDDGIHGSMPDPTFGEVAHDVQHAGQAGPYSGDVTFGSTAKKGELRNQGDPQFDPLARRSRGLSEKGAGDHYLKPGEQAPEGAKVQQGPRGGKFIPGGGGGGQLHPRDEQDLQSLKVQKPAAPKDDEMAGAPQWVREATQGTPENSAARERQAQSGLTGQALRDAEEDVHTVAEDLMMNREAKAALEKNVIGLVERIWERDLRTGDLSEDAWEDATDGLERTLTELGGGKLHPEAVKSYAKAWAVDLLQPFLDRQTAMLEDYGYGDHPSLSPGERNPSMGRWSSDPVYVSSSANVHKGAAFVQRPVK